MGEYIHVPMKSLWETGHAHYGTMPREKSRKLDDTPKAEDLGQKKGARVSLRIWKRGTTMGAIDCAPSVGDGTTPVPALSESQERERGSTKP